MPEVNFVVRWPDGQEDPCYSPSLVIKSYFEPGEQLSLGAFVQRSREALQEASNRVEAKYGFQCSRALGQLRQIEQTAHRYAEQFDAPPDGSRDPWTTLQVAVTRFV